MNSSVHAESPENAPDGRDPALQWIVDRRFETDRPGLGHAVGDGDFVQMHFVDQALHQLGGTRRTRDYSGS